jgi:Histidine kinase
MESVNPPTGWRAARPYLAITCAYWLYVMLSNLLYAKGMSSAFLKVSPEKMFAPPVARILQHLELFPLLVVGYWASFKIGWRRLWRAVPLQFAIGAIFGILAGPALTLGEWLSNPAGHMAIDQHGATIHATDDVDLGVWSASATHFLLTYGFGLALLTSFHSYRRFRDAEIRVTAMEKAWSSARLAALRMQLSPHTLFNLLHLIRGQIAWDPRAAQALIVQLADLLRRLLNAGERDFCQLKDEFDFVKLYLELQQKRFADRLSIRLPESATLPNVWVPSLILQPLIENAVVHGLAGHEGAVSIAADAELNGQQLCLRISNTVAPSHSTGAESVGLRNVRERLQVHFGATASMQSNHNLGGQWVAEIRLPIVRERP